MNTNNLKIDANGAIYDFVFIGLGASNSLLLKSISEQPKLRNKKIAIIESDNKNTNDKTYCFWAEPKDSIVKELSPLIRYKYESIVINRLPKQQINDHPYHYISSIDLYAYTAGLIKQQHYTIYRHKVEVIESHSGIQTIHTNQGTIQSYFIFDSRPPAYKDILKTDVYLHQSFYGLQIKCERDVFDDHSFEMMNFNVDQNEFTQFIYILPFSKREALIELTRFGSQKIEIEYAKTILIEKINKDFGHFEIVADESGCIPMTTFLQPISENKGILNTGGRANLIKPSTGYGFKNMFAFSKVVTQRLVDDDLENFNKIALKSKPRFKFYDHLLLIILFKWPTLGKSIFSTLFKKQNTTTIFSFLDEKTSLLQEIKIFAKLPTLPFLKALIIYLHSKGSVRYLIAFGVVALYLLFSIVNQPTADYYSYAVVAIGLMIVGIPHGAVDHLLSFKQAFHLQLTFVLKYLFIFCLMFILWQMIPTVALVLFILYSAFHFGESEYEHAMLKMDSLPQLAKAFFLGLSIVLFIVSSHWDEALPILTAITDASSVVNFHAMSNSVLMLVAFLSLLYVLIDRLKSDKQKDIGLVLMLLLGLFTPLMLAFALYFIGQHSCNAWQHLKTGLSLSSAALYKKAMPFTLGAFLLLGLVVLNITCLTQSIEHSVASFFVFLSCISCPHIFMMHSFYKRSTL